MSINRAIGNAFSGLTAQARAAELVSRNLSNASVDGYAARQASLVHRVYGDQGGGVSVSAVTRAGDPMLTASRRVATADTALQSGDAENMRALADLLGIEGVEESLAARYADLEEALGALADSPESPTVQRTAAEAANMLARSFNVISTDARRLRVEADADISRQIEKVNAALAKIERLNKEIQAAAAAGRDATGLEDERDRQIEIVNAIVPIRAKQTGNGAVELRSTAGALLVGSKAWPLVKDPQAKVSGVYSTGPDGAAVEPNLAPKPNSGPGALRGGSLEAAYRMYEETAPAFERQLDAMAADLILRFQAVTGAGGADVPAPPAAPAADALGIFVEGDIAGDRWLDGKNATGASLEGLAGRLKVNQAVLDAPQKLPKGLYANKADIGDATVPAAFPAASATAFP